jgi:hypothetical protein
VSEADVARAVEMAGRVKDAPHQAILRLADQLTGSIFGVEAGKADPCCGAQEAKGKKGTAGRCCG